MTLQVTGLAGFDSGALITRLVEIARRPLNEIDARRAKLDSASSTLNSFATRMTALKSAASALSTASGFSSMGATSSDTAIVATVTGSAPRASYAVSVSQLARPQKSRSDAQASATTALGQIGDLAITVGTAAPVNVSVLATDTLADIAGKINGSGARISASIINAGGSYRLSLQGLDSGAANGFSVAELNTLNLGFANPASLIENARDAQLSIDGLPVTRATNQIADAIPGVTLALTKETTSPATVAVSPDSTNLKTKINAFVTAFNDVGSAGRLAAGSATIKAANSVLAGDTAIRRALDRVTSITTGVAAGASDDLRSVAAVGLSISKEGTLSFDAAKFDAAITRDPDGVRRLFIEDASIGATGVMGRLATAVDGMITGNEAPIRARIDALGRQSRQLGETRALRERSIASYEELLRKQYLELDKAMSRYQSMSSSLDSLGRNSNNQ